MFKKLSPVTRYIFTNPGPLDSLSVYYQNVRGLRTKLHYLLENVPLFEYDIIILTETWLSSGFHDSELHFDGFDIYRRDRSPNTSVYCRGGGVLVATKKHLVSQLLPSSPDIEQLIVLLECRSRNLLICTAYIPPRSPVEAYVSFSSSLENLSENINADLCIAGDFNLPHSVWENSDLSSIAVSLTGTSQKEVDSLLVLSNLSCFYNLYQCNNCINDHGSLLDLVLLSCSIITDVRISSEPLVPPDAYHPPLCFQLQITCENHNKDLIGEGYYRDFHSLNNEMIDFLGQFTWDILFHDQPLDIMINIFYEILYLGIELYVPLKKYSTRKFPRWFNSNLKEKIVQKKGAHRRFQTTGFQSDYLEFSTLRAECRRLTKIAYKEYVYSTELALQSNVRKFWDFVNSKREQAGIPNELEYNGMKGTTGIEIANLFAEYFNTVYSSAKGDLTKIAISINTNNIAVPSISISEIFIKLSALDTNKGPGPDGIPPSLLKLCSFILARPLHYIFNKSLENGHFPNSWKTSFITPIFKSGDRSSISNYRPISILSSIPKIFESLIYDYLLRSFNNMLIDQQFGFRPNSSPELNLLTYNQFLFEALEDGYSVHSVYTDFSKAFDRVNHELLIHKLKLLGVCDLLLSWIRSYLTGRTQQVRIKGFISKELKVLSGVPQGSHLGPLLFNLFINDICKCFQHSNYLLFADDLKIFLKILDMDSCLLLQSDLCRLSEWCDLNCMQLNTSKCHWISFGRMRNPIRYAYHIANVPLVSDNEVKDLGVIYDSQLSFIPHIEGVVSRSLQMLGFIKRCCQDFSNIEAIKTLYCSLVRSLLEYASSVWSPHYNVHIMGLEKIQKKVLRFIGFKLNLLQNPQYDDLYQISKLDALEVRRQIHDLKLFYKLVNGKVTSPWLLSKIKFRVPVRQTRTTSLFYVPLHHTNYGQNCFTTRCAKLAGEHPSLDFFTDEPSFFRQLKTKLSERVNK